MLVLTVTLISQKFLTIPSNDMCRQEENKKIKKF